MSRTENRNITSFKPDIDNGTCLMWSVFTSVQSQFWENSENALYRYGNQQSGCRDTSLHKAAAQPERGMRRSPSIKHSLCPEGNTRRWDLFLQTHAATFNVQRSDWCTLGAFKGIFMLMPLHKKRSWWWCFEPTRLSPMTCSSGRLAVNSFSSAPQWLAGFIVEIHPH